MSIVQTQLETQDSIDRIREGTMISSIYEFMIRFGTDEIKDWTIEQTKLSADYKEGDKIDWNDEEARIIEFCQFDSDTEWINSILKKFWQGKFAAILNGYTDMFEIVVDADRVTEIENEAVKRMMHDNSWNQLVQDFYPEAYDEYIKLKL